MVRRRRRFGTNSDGQAERCRGAPMRSAPVVWVGWEAVDQNQPACGGAREGGNREGAARASLVSGWVRIFLITSGSSMQAMIRSAPPQAGQVSMSMPKTRFSRCAHVIAMDGMYAGFCRSKNRSLLLGVPPAFSLVPPRRLWVWLPSPAFLVSPRRDLDCWGQIRNGSN